MQILFGSLSLAIFVSGRSGDKELTIGNSGPRPIWYGYESQSLNFEIASQ